MVERLSRLLDQLSPITFPLCLNVVDLARIYVIHLKRKHTWFDRVKRIEIKENIRRNLVASQSYFSW